MLDGYIYNSNLFKNDFQYKFDESTGMHIHTHTLKKEIFSKNFFFH